MDSVTISSALQLFCHKVQAANAILSVVKSNWTEIFLFHRLTGIKIGFASLA